MKKWTITALTFLMIMATPVYSFAATLPWSSVPGNHGEKSLLLPEGEKSSTDVFHRYGRGEVFSEGSIEIANRKNGEIYIRAYTLAHVDVDEIYHSIFLDQWDDSINDWKQVGHWEFEEARGNKEQFSLLHTSFILDGYPTNKYYRARALHGVTLNDTFEGCVTTTHGVLITKN